MTVSVAKAVREQVADPDTEAPLAFRVVADLPVAELLAYVQAGLADFERQWEADRPIVRDGEVVPPAAVMAMSSFPDVEIAMEKITDLPLTFERLVSALNAAVPVRARLERPRRRRLPIGVLRAVLNLRLALNGHWERQRFVLDEDLDEIDARIVDWMQELQPETPWHIEFFPTGRWVPVEPGAELDTLREHRQYKTTCLIASRGDRFRAVADWVPAGFVSLISGTTDREHFDWREHWAVIDPVFRTLEPATRTAVLARAEHDVFLESGRKLRRPEHHAGVSRAIQEHGLIDAQGRFFTTDPPGDRIPATWTQTPYGHLTQTDAPDLDAWFTTKPTETLLDAARDDLTALISDDGRWHPNHGLIPPERTTPTTPHVERDTSSG